MFGIILAKRGNVQYTVCKVITSYEMQNMSHYGHNSRIFFINLAYWDGMCQFYLKWASQFVNAMIILKHLADTLCFETYVANKGAIHFAMSTV